MKVTALEVPGAGGTTLKINLLLPVRLIFRVGAVEDCSVEKFNEFGPFAVTHL